jgi:hypothetical protein|tara:strand:- start:966 stop:1346 length:381 start_codon:yes stop_codon:yes gene_type:complete
MKDLHLAILIGGLLGVFHGFSQPSYSGTVVPNFTRGTVTSETSTKTTVVETIRQIDYTTGESYTVTGTNINIPSNPGPDTEYSIVTPGAPFQFSETYLGPGIASEIEIDRTTTVDSFTTSISVFTQ